MEAQERFPKRRKSDTSFSVPAIDGATAQVRGWSYGNLPKRDATRFFRAVSLSLPPSLSLHRMQFYFRVFCYLYRSMHLE